MCRYCACAPPFCLQYCPVPSRRQQRAGRVCGSCPPAVALLGQQGAHGTATAQGLSASSHPGPGRPGREGSGNPRQEAWGGAAPCTAIADGARPAPWCSSVSARRLLPAGCLPSRNTPPPHRALSAGSRLLKGYRGGHVVIRLALGGCTNRPFYRIVAAHSRRARDGKYLEQLGCLDPLPNARGEKVAGLNLERLRHWLGCGAQLSRPAEKLLGMRRGGERGWEPRGEARRGSAPLFLQGWRGSCRCTP